jgi:hypothetical protein
MTTPTTPATTVPIAPPVTDEAVAAADSQWGML